MFKMTFSTVIVNGKITETRAHIWQIDRGTHRPCGDVELPNPPHNMPALQGIPRECGLLGVRWGSGPIVENLGQVKVAGRCSTSEEPWAQQLIKELQVWSSGVSPKPREFQESLVTVKVTDEG